MKLIFRRDNSEQLVTLINALGRSGNGDLLRLAGSILHMLPGATYGLTLEVTPHVPDHTEGQRGYYHKWKKHFADYTGNTPDEMHEHILREAYGSETVQTRLGPVVRPLQRSSTANRVEYSVLIDTLIRVAAEMDFIVPPPYRGHHNPPQPQERSHESSERKKKSSVRPD